MNNNLDATVFVYRHRDTSEVKALYHDSALGMTYQTDYEHVATLEPRAWIEATWSSVMQANDVSRALKNLVVATQHLEVCPGALEEARKAIKTAGVRE